MRNRIVKYLALVLLGAALYPFQIASGATATLRVGSMDAVPGSTVEVPINVLGASGIGGLQMELLYDPAVLTAESVTRGSLLGGNALIESNVSQRGRVILAMVTLDDLKGDGTIALVRFKAIGTPGQSSALTLEKIKAYESNSERQILMKSQAGRVTIGIDWLPWAVLGVIGLGVILGLIVIFAWFRRRRPAPQSIYASPPPIELPEGNRSRPPTNLPR